MAEYRSPDAPPSYEEIMGMGMPSYVNSYNRIQQVIQNASSLNSLSPNASPSSQPYNHLIQFPIPSLLVTHSAYNSPVRTSNIVEDLLKIEKALNLSNPDVPLLMSVLCHRKYDERLQIAQKYQQKYGKPLIQQIKQHFTSDFGKLMNGLVVPYYEYLARTIHNSKNFKWLYYVLFTVSNREIIQMKDYFEAKYNQSVEKFIKYRSKNDDSKDRIRVRPILRMLEARRNEMEFGVDPNEVKEDVRKLNTIVGGSLFGGTYEEKQIVKDIFYFKSFNHIKAVAYEYTKQHNGKHVCSIIYKVYSSQLNIFMSIINYAINKYYYFATLLKKSMRGMSTDGKLLMHVMVRRFSVGDLTDICNEYNRQNDEPLRKRIGDNSSGYYKYALYSLIGEQPRSRSVC